MDAGGIHRRLAGWEIHGFRTMEDLDIGSMFEEARERWLRPNEIHAILCNHTNFKISVKPVNLPKSGTLVLFDRKMLRNFRKDGHNWKKKKDGKTVKEAHEHLKVGDEERIHVYYAHGEDNPTFVRRCYWLLDKKLEHIVLVHYRTTQELKVSIAAPVNSKSSSTYSNPSASGVLSEEIESADCAYFTHEKGNPEHATLENHEMRLHEINTLEWEELLATNDPVESMASRGANSGTFLEQHTDMVVNGSKSYVRPLPARNMPAESLSCGIDPVATINSGHFDSLDSVGFKKMEDQTNPNMPEILDDSLDISVQDTLQTQDSFGRWINCIISASPGSVDNSIYESPISTGHGSNVSPMTDEYQSAVLEQIFSITDISPAWGFSTEETKILVVGFFHGEQQRHENCNLLCVCGDAYVPVEKFQVGVFRAVVPPHTPGLVNFFLSFDGHRPISQIITFEYRVPLTISPEHKPNLEEFQVQMRLAHLLFSTSSMLRILSSKVLQNNLKKAREFTLKTSHTATQWTSLIKLVEDKKFSFPQVNDCLFEHALANRLKEWLVERIIEGAKITEQDNQGQGVIHLCAILGYTWAVRLFALSGISLNSRDKSGWTAIHWAAYSGREKMVAALLSAGAKPNLVTDPTPTNPGGYTAADLASKMGHDGLGAYLAEKSLVEHFKDMTIAGNVSGSLQISTTDSKNTENLTEDEVYLKDSLSAYRTAADAAARIQTAFREHSLKVQTNAVQTSNPEDEARNIVAAMKIQHAFRNHEIRKKMAAAARIQHRFRSWKIRREFLNMRRQAIKIQAAFRGFQVRRQYHKIVWSVGVLEKAILRWRLKRKGFRGLQASPIGEDTVHGKENDPEEDFFRASRKQAEERIERSVVRVQAMFRSRQAQQEYHRMKFACDQAKLELEAELDPDFEMDGGGRHF